MVVVTKVFFLREGGENFFIEVFERLFVGVFRERCLRAEERLGRGECVAWVWERGGVITTESFREETSESESCCWYCCPYCCCEDM